ncbi:hypothetical protein BDY21DRAFT_330921 [Lineolata rhizophorae]|uniref:Uncharacterized protein n=1 Tax=Lineolata rhizophorae TaxID=578093 RepID=A0A6A6PE70_9PEZI|nr:hypothetical protein BDY21DRAFT_330921 [Lineolata rhizophorae]
MGVLGVSLGGLGFGFWVVFCGREGLRVLEGFFCVREGISFAVGPALGLVAFCSFWTLWERWLVRFVFVWLSL